MPADFHPETYKSVPRVDLVLQFLLRRSLQYMVLQVDLLEKKEFNDQLFIKKIWQKCEIAYKNL